MNERQRQLAMDGLAILLLFVLLTVGLIAAARSPANSQHRTITTAPIGQSVVGVRPSP